MQMASCLDVFCLFFLGSQLDCPCPMPFCLGKILKWGTEQCSQVSVHNKVHVMRPDTKLKHKMVPPNAMSDFAQCFWGKTLCATNHESSFLPLGNRLKLCFNAVSQLGLLIGHQGNIGTTQCSGLQRQDTTGFGLRCSHLHSGGTAVRKRHCNRVGNVKSVSGSGELAGSSPERLAFLHLVVWNTWQETLLVLLHQELWGDFSWCLGPSTKFRFVCRRNETVLRLGGQGNRLPGNQRRLGPWFARRHIIDRHEVQATVSRH